MNELQQAIYDKIERWAEFASALGPLVSQNYYYAWLLRAKLAPQDELNAALRQMVDNGAITAKSYHATPCAETNYDITPNTATVTILALPPDVVDKINKKRKKR